MDVNTTQSRDSKWTGLNVKAAKEIDKARMKLPKKFQGLIGFNQIIPITDEYGTVINTDVKRIGIDEAKIEDESSFIDDLGADSLDTVELVMAFEEEFGIEIPDEAAETIQSFGDAVKFITEAV